MASIKEEGTRSKRLSYKIRVCLGCDENGRQISKAMRWNPPEDMTPAKAKKEAQRVAAVWEAEQKEAFERQKAQKEGRKTDYTFGQFVDEVSTAVTKIQTFFPMAREKLVSPRRNDLSYL